MKTRFRFKNLEVWREAGKINHVRRRLFRKF